MRKILLTTTLLLASSWAAGAEGKASEALVRQYMSYRPEVFSMTERMGMPAAAPTPEQLAETTQALLRSLRPTPDWNSSHPDWARMQKVIEADLPAVLKALTDDPQLKQTLASFNDALASGIASQLSDEQVRQLTQHYVQADAVRFAAVEADIIKQTNFAMGQVQLLAAGGKPFQPPPGQDLKEMGVLVSLMSEQMALQLGLVDPGPNGDRSGLQALPILMGWAVSFSFDKIDAAWMRLPEPQRSATLAWRASPLAKAELQAIYEGGKRIGALPEFQAQALRMGEKMRKYMQKWQAQLNGSAAQP